jgi:hypothetical protein
VKTPWGKRLACQRGEESAQRALSSSWTYETLY